METPDTTVEEVNVEYTDTTREDRLRLYNLLRSANDFLPGPEHVSDQDIVLTTWPDVPKALLQINIWIDLPNELRGHAE